MSYCNKIMYRVLNTDISDFPRMVDYLLVQLPHDETMLRLTFFGCPGSNEEYIRRHAIIRERVGSLFKAKVPALSYVAQPPLNGSLCLESLSYLPDKEDKLFYKADDVSYVLLENNTGRFLFAGGFQSDIVNSGIEEQSVDVLLKVKRLLDKENFPIESIVRQWNYIERITSFEGKNQHYQLFNNARAGFYNDAQWRNGYPAATGIGTDLGGILVDLDAIVVTTDDAYITPIDNPMQIAAHKYSAQVLETTEKKTETPRFERAKSLTIRNDRLIYVSGTAAIRGEESLNGAELERQLHTTMENIGTLAGSADLHFLRVYLKKKDDYEEARRLLDTSHADIPVSYLCADICRDELLIEVEGVAVEKSNKLI